MKAWLRHIFPLVWRQQIRHLQRSMADLLSGAYFRFSKKRDASPWHATEIRVEQWMNNSALAENKRKNIQIAMSKLDGLIIYPREMFSFWYLVKSVSKRKGYLKGRNLRGGKLVEGYGGGLCQLAGIIYYTMLLSGLTTKERHAHSVDIYREEERYTPLGADAAVLYGYKDLRMQNNLEHPVQLNFAITKTKLVCQLKGIGLRKREINFCRKTIGNEIYLETFVKAPEGSWNSVDVAVYQSLYTEPSGISK